MPGDTFIVIGPDVPAIVTAFYTANYGTVIGEAWIGEYCDADNYHYEIWGTGAIIGAQHAVGWVNSGVVRELYYDYFDGIQVVRAVGQVSQIQEAWFHAQFIGGDLGGGYADFQWDSVSVSRGVQAAVRATSTVTTVTTGTTELNLPQLEIPFVNVYAGRQYEFGGRAMIQQSVGTDTFDLRVRRDTALTGTQVGFVRFSLSQGPVTVPILGTFQANVTETVTLFVSLVRVGGTGTCTFTPRVAGGNAQLSSYFKISDEGSFTGPGSAWTTSN